ncbi:ankyrin and HET domain-containing protein [Seiridium cupressi]
MNLSTGPGFHNGKAGTERQAHESEELIGSHSIYKYVRLEESQMRLLTLLPGKFQDPIKCSMKTVDSLVFDLQRVICDSDPPDVTYEALSYVWASDEDDVVIRIDNAQFKITVNVNHALHCLRLPDVSRIFWIDAICINQEDLKEKSEQVCMMDRIYRNAETVIIYLGPDADESNLVMEYLSVDDYELLNDDGELFTDPGLRMAKAQGGGMRLSTESERTFLVNYFIQRGINEDRIAQAAYAFFCRPWWTRMWVIQEAKLAKRDPVWYCGQQWTTMRRLRERLPALHNFTLMKKQPGYISKDVVLNANPRGRRKPYGDLMAWSRAVESIFFTVDPALPNLHIQSLSKWLEFCTARQSTDARDRIFALVSMLSPIARHVLVPDYSESVHRTFLHATVFILLFEACTQVFSLYGFTRERGIPSWSLDFTRPFPGLLAAEYFAEYQSAYWYTKPLQVRADGTKLVLSGIDFDVIHVASNTVEGASNFEILATRRMRQRMLLEYQHLLSRLKQPSPDSLPLLTSPAYDDYGAANSYIAALQGLDEDYMEILKSMVRSREELPGAIHFSCDILKGIAMHVAVLAECARCEDSQRHCKSPPARTIRHRAYSRTVMSTMTQDFLDAAAFELSKLQTFIDSIEIESAEMKSSMPVSATSTNSGFDCSPLKTALSTAQSREELDTMKTMAKDMADLCHSLIVDHVNCGTLSPTDSIDETGKRLALAYTNAKTFLHQTIASCTCSGRSERQNHRSEIEAQHHELCQEQLIFDKVIQFSKKRRDAESIPAEALAFVRDRTAVFITEAKLIGFSFQHEPGFEQGDKLVLLNEFQAPMILRQVDGGDTFRIKGAAYVQSLIDVDFESLVEDGVLEERQFRIL